MLFLTHLQDICHAQADKVAIELSAEKLTYQQLETGVQQTMTYLLAHGIGEGDRVAIQLPKCLPFVLIHLATMRLGAISLPLNPAYPARETEYFLSDADVKLYVTAGDENPNFASATISTNLADFRQMVAQFEPSIKILPNERDQTALMIYTSGTTGRPKGAQITHGNLTANITGLHRAWGWRADDILLHVLPIFHVHGLIVALHGALHAGATAILLPKFTPQLALETMVNRRCTVFMAVPTIHKRLVEFEKSAEYDLSHMRLLTSGSDRLPDDLFTRYQSLFGHTLLERYGMTETGMNLSNPLVGERRVGSVGLPLPGVEARVVDPESDEPLPDGEVGEVQIRGPHVFKGYWRMAQKSADAFTKDGWLRTGDLGLREPDGYFTLKGRSKDLIITGGLNVYPPEVELVLSELPAVAASAVIGCPDDEWGEQITAVVVLRAGHRLTEAEIIAFCRTKLAAYKAPRRVIFADELPRNALGKVQKARLRESAC